MKRLAKVAGLKTTQKFSPDYSSILLKDDTGRQGRFYLVQLIVEPGGLEWDESWFALARRLHELFEWDVPVPECSAEEITFDPF